MKAITIWQPWASLLACGAKKFETRSWATNYRGPIAIHAAKKDPHSIILSLPHDTSKVIYDSLYTHFGIQSGALSRMTTGCIIATAELVECWKITDRGHTLGSRHAARIEGGMYGGKTNIVEGKEIFFGNWTPGRYAWELVNVIMLPEPIPVKGRQGLWNWEG